MTQTHEEMRIEQGMWCEGWRRTPWYLRLLGAKRDTYADDRGSVRMKWGQLSLRRSGLALQIGAYESAHLNIALLLFQVFIRLPFLDRAMTTGDNAIENPQFGFSADGDSVHLSFGRWTKVVWWPWKRVWQSREFYSENGEWLPIDQLRRDWKPDEGIAASIEKHPYHYMLSDGTVQHVTATIHRERCWSGWTWFGGGRKARLSNRLRALQKRMTRPEDYIKITFSEGIGEDAGSWKGGCVGCSYQMKPGERPRNTLLRMQRERRFR